MPLLSPVPERPQNRRSAMSPESPDTGVVKSPSESGMGPTLSFDDNHIRVCCRVRPPNSREAAFDNTSSESLKTANGKACSGDEAVAAVAATNRCLTVLADRTTVVLNAKPTPKVFTFDFAVPENATQEEIFLSIGRPITNAVLEGYNSTVLAYGQTGSGKSHTMFGPDSIMSTGGVDGAKDLQGLVPRCLEYLFTHIARETRRTNGAVQYTCRCSFFEIFNERVFDLLDAACSSGASSDDAVVASEKSDRSSSSNSRASRGSSSSMMLPLEDLAGLTVREDTRRGVYVDGLNEMAVGSASEAGSALGKGYRNRRVAETAMNRESSRSHAVFQLLVESTERGTGKDSGVRKAKQSRFSLVDLAGSERQKSTSATGDRLKEANAINKSLSSLGLVINALVDRGCGKMRHVPYRDSKLTFLLRDSLGGNSRTTLVATVSPSDEQFGESLSTLKFSQRAKMITNTAVVNEEAVGSLETLQKEVLRLKQELIRAKAIAAAKFGPASVASDPFAAPTSPRTSTEPASGDADALLSESLERFMVVHKQSKRYMGQLTTAHDASARYQEMVMGANLIIKLLRAKAKGASSNGAKEADEAAFSGQGLDDRDAATLAAVEKSLGRLPEVEKWRLACLAMKGDLDRLAPSSSPAEPPAELGSTLCTDPAVLKALADMAAGRKDRDKALAGKWSAEQEGAFQVGLEERFAKVVKERDALKKDLAAMEMENHREGATNVPSPSNSEKGELNDALSMFSSQFGDSGKPSLDLMGDDDADILPPSRNSLGGGRRSSVGTTRRVSVGGKVVVGLSDVASWSAAHEVNRKLREADGKAEALAKQLDAKAKEVAELGKANAVLAREKAELVQAAAVMAAQGSMDSAATPAAPAAGKVLDEAAVAKAVAEAVAEAMAGASVAMATLQAEVEALMRGRYNDSEAAEKAETALRLLAQNEIEACSAAKAEAAAAREEAAAAKAETAAALEAADGARSDSLAAKEAEEAGAARCKDLEDELETAGEQVAYLKAGQEAAAAEASALKAKLAASEECAEQAGKALAAAKAAGAALQAQLLSSSLDTGSALEGLQRQLADQAAQLAAALDDARDATALRASVTSALASSERAATDLRVSLAAMEAELAGARGVCGDLTAEVKGLREKVSQAVAAKERLSTELAALTTDRDEVARALEDAERDASGARDELEAEKGHFLDELAKQADAASELEEALEAEQQMAMDQTAKHKEELGEMQALFDNATAALRAEASAAGARAEQAEAEASLLRRETQRDVVDGERELLATQASLRREEKARRETASALAVALAKAEEHSRTANDLALQVSSLEGERTRLLERTISRDVELEKAHRESSGKAEEASYHRMAHAATAERLAALEASQAETQAIVDGAVAAARAAAAEAAVSKAMEKEAHDALVASKAKAAGLEAALIDATGRLEEYAAQVAGLAGHGNAKQKIHTHLKLKEEINDLQKHNSDMHQKIARLEAGLPAAAPKPGPPPLPPPPLSKRSAPSPPVEEAPKENAVAVAVVLAAKSISGDCTSSPQPAPQRRTSLGARVASPNSNH